MPCQPGQRFSGYPSSVAYTDCTSTPRSFTILDLQERDIQSNNRLSVRRPPGSVDPAAYLLAKHEPQISMSTNDLLTALTHVPLMNGLLTDACLMYLQQRAMAEGAFMVGNYHVKMAIARSFLYVESIVAEANQEDGVQLNLTQIPLHVPAPVFARPIEITSNYNVAGAGLTPSFVSAYFLGPLVVNSVEMRGVESVRLEPQIRVVASPVSGSPAMNQMVAIVSREARIVVRTKKVDDVNNYDFVPGLAGAVDLYLQKADPTHATGDGRVAYGSAAHIKISAAGSVVDPGQQSHRGPDDATQEYHLKLTGTPTISVASVMPNSAIYPAA